MLTIARSAKTGSMARISSLSYDDRGGGHNSIVYGRQVPGFNDADEM